MGFIETEYQDQRPRYWLCGAGFFLLGLSMALLALSSGLVLIGSLTGDRDLFNLLQHPWWTWFVSLPLSYGAVLGSYLLWGRWSDASWQRRAALLVLLNTFDAVMVTLFEAENLGLPIPPFGEDWLLTSLTLAFGWIEFYLAVSLATEVASHLGTPSANDAGRIARGMSVGGLALAFFLFAIRTNWSGGWPLQEQPIRDEMTLLMVIGSIFLRTMNAAQTASLCFLAFRNCRRTWKEIGEWAVESNSTSLPGASWPNDRDHRS